MNTLLKKELSALERMTVNELREKHRSIFGEENRSRHKDFLRKRIAWRLQALDEGGLTERALQRAKELANDADLRIRMPVSVPVSFNAPERTALVKFHDNRDARLPLPGTVLVREYRGQVVRVTVLKRGFDFEGEIHSSLSAIAKAVTGTQWNGMLFFGLAKKGTANESK